MKLFATVVASAASQGFYDYNLFNTASQPASSYGKYGTVNGKTSGGDLRSGNGRFCHATKDEITIHRWDVSKNGFFSHYNLVQCQGEELYCFMEERAHFGQVIGIRAGCAQMMNHPQVRRTRVGSQQTYNNNREAFLDATLDAEINANNFFYPSWYQSQCLRSASRAASTGNWHDLLPFGVSVCRACCVAGIDTETDYHEDTGDSAPCNFLPYKQPARGTDKNERPHIPFGYDFNCIQGYAQDMAAGGITYHDPVATKDKIRHYSCNDVIRNVRSTCNTEIGNSGVFEACTDAEWYASGADGICNGNISGAVECYPKTFAQADKLIGDTVTVSNAFSFAAHTWAGTDASDCDICRNELVPRFDGVSFNSGSRVNLFAAACDSTTKRCDPMAKSVIDMALNPNEIAGQLG